MPLATVDQLASWLGRDFGPPGSVESERARLMLGEAEAVIIDEAGQPLDSRETTEVLDGTGHRLLTLGRWPVTNLSAVHVKGTALDVSEDVEWSATGVVKRLGEVWPESLRSVKVTYTAGHDPLPDVLTEVCLAAAARGYTNPEGKVQDSYGEWQTRFTPTDGVGLTSAERRIVARYAA